MKYSPLTIFRFSRNRLKKGFRSVFLVLSLVLIFVPTIVQAQSATKYEQLFWEQLGNSCQEGKIWEKSVYDLGGDSPDSPQTKSYRLDCRTGVFVSVDGDLRSNPGTEEFDFLFEYDASNRYIVDYFDISEGKSGFTALIKSDNVNDTPLQGQEFKLDPSGKLRYAQSRILKDNMLYYLKVTIEVWFDEEGRYEKHKIETETDPVAQDGVHTLIKGRLTD